MKKPIDSLSKEDLLLKNGRTKTLKEFEYLKTTEDVVADFTLAQAKEICKYIRRLDLTPLYGWRKFLQDSIDRDEVKFVEGFYLIKNEFGVLEPDFERIDKLRISK